MVLGAVSLCTLAVLVLLACTVPERAAASPTPACDKPDIHQLNDQLAQFIHNTGFHESFYGLSFLRTSIENELEDTKVERGRVFQGEIGTSECPEGDDFHGPLCPTFHIRRINEDRFPEVLMEAQAACDRCLSQSEESSCEPIHYAIPVLLNTHRVGADNTCVYEGSWYDLPVGYTCVPLRNHQPA